MVNVYLNGNLYNTSTDFDPNNYPDNWDNFISDLAAHPISAASATSTTSLAVGTGSKVFTTQQNKNFQAGSYIYVYENGTPANYMAGTVTSYSGATLTINVTHTGGSGTIADWKINAAGAPGVGTVNNTVADADNLDNIVLSNADVTNSKSFVTGSDGSNTTLDLTRTGDFGFGSAAVNGWFGALVKATANLKMLLRNTNAESTSNTCNVTLRLETSGGNNKDAFVIEASLSDVTDASATSKVAFKTVNSGASATPLELRGNEIFFNTIGSSSSGDAGKLYVNASDYVKRVP